MIASSGGVLGFFELGRRVLCHSNGEDSLRNFGGLFLLSFFITAGRCSLLPLLISSFGRVDHNQHIVAFCG